MKGVECVVDDNGEQQAAPIDLKRRHRLWEGFCGAAVAKDREDEPRESFEEVCRKAPGDDQ